ncbi:protein spire homolog 1 isoform X1 [Lingula anatina]|uniref:Protein spire homolog 1 isoform X1 n=1 Tax=Lingula anatina TaxID=7574 RepID=A0A1S3JL17_LINAN|nr:protein spire homolog 1 isoform X1 [Lingula anatina]|eukprot:XP_013411067.1 protein spire homolog 1 isoform X1 [Lingula anatina]
MAARSGGARERLSKIADKLSLQDILEAFNAPLNEEQAWAICFQCLQHLKKHWDAGNAIYIYGLPSVYVHKDGTVSCEAPTTGKQSTECQIIESLGLVLFSALDYGLPENEEQRLSPLLESAIARMTGNDADKSSSDAGHDDGCHSDEGIAEDEDEDGGQGQSVTFQDVIQDCINHLHSPGEAASHYKAVCRALLAEAQELLTFLVNISLCREKLKAEDGEEDLEDLQRADWARLWMQVMKTLRKGVKLKEVEHVNKPPVEYELTPYEILMEDIRSRRYTLNKVAANGALPPKLKQNAHEIILDFIRSRPPLHPVTNRKLANPRPRTPDLHEQLISEIKNPPKLRSTPYEEEVETSRTTVSESDCSPAPTRRLIKADLSLLITSSVEDEVDDEDNDTGYDGSEKKFSSLNSSQMMPWQKTVALDLAVQSANDVPERRHSISVCESPGALAKVLPLGQDLSPIPAPLQTNQDTIVPNPMECLSLRIDEVMHIRSVLTKAELECLYGTDMDMYNQVSKGKICFTCRVTKFGMFGPWGVKCKFCKRKVCNKCSKKMRIPTEHFEHIPVYTLSPSSSSPEEKEEQFTTSTYSLPPSPVLDKKIFDHHSYEVQKEKKSTLTRKVTIMDKDKDHETRRSTLSRIFSNDKDKDKTNHHHHHGKKHLSLTRKFSKGKGDASKLQGPMMDVCRDCKEMVLNVIRASRTTLSATSSSTPSAPKPANPVSRKPSRQFHLDLKPIYKF